MDKRKQYLEFWRRFLAQILGPILPVLILCLASVGCAGEPSINNADIEPFVRWLLDDGERLEDVRFAEVAEAVSGYKCPTRRYHESGGCGYAEASAGIARRNAPRTG